MSGGLLDRILAPGALTTLFQPIFQVRGGTRSIIALEALTRGPRGTNVERSDVLFEYVRRKGQEVAIDRLTIAAALRHSSQLPWLPGICLNVHAATLERDSGLALWLTEIAAESGVALSRIVIEIVEHAPPWSGRQFLASLDRLRGLGIRIALDDVGLGQSSFRMILDCRPDLLKIDRHFVAGAHEDHRRRAVLDSVASLAQKLGGKAVAEGIEDERDLATALASGIDLVQGYFLCRPHTPETLCGMEVLKRPSGGAARPEAARSADDQIGIL